MDIVKIIKAHTENLQTKLSETDEYADDFEEPDDIVIFAFYFCYLVDGGDGALLYYELR